MPENNEKPAGSANSAHDMWVPPSQCLECRKIGAGDYLLWEAVMRMHHSASFSVLAGVKPDGRMKTWLSWLLLGVVLGALLQWCRYELAGRFF